MRDAAVRPLTDDDPSRWRALVLVSTAVFLGMSGWFTAAAVSPELAVRWGLDDAAVGWLTTTVQLGFVAGTAVAALANVADIVPARRYFAYSAWLAALANAALLVAPAYGVALVARFLTGFFLAGVYPPAMKMIATWFRSARGLAIGTVVGALVVGKAVPYLLEAVERAGPAAVIGSASLAGMAAGALVLWRYRDGPYPFARAVFSWGLVGRIVRHRPTMLATGGYLGHMWELYAVWTLSALFFRDFFAARGLDGDVRGALMGFGVIAMGGLGAVAAGAWADRLGRERVTIAALAVSGLCSVTVGWLAAAPAPLVVGLALVWGFAVVADSAQFSAVVTEVAPSDAVGTALTLQTSLGFALTAVSIWLTIEIKTRFGWGPAFSALALGPAFGIASMVALARERRAT